MSLTNNKWLFFVPVVIAVVAVVALKQKKAMPEQVAIKESSQTVSYIVAEPLDVTPQIVSHGTVSPSKSWSSVSRVKGKVIEKNHLLEKGAIIESGTLIYRIDPVDYQLTIAQIEAEIDGLEAQIDESITREKNTQATLAIEEQALKLSKKELDRKTKLNKEGTLSSSALETQQRTYLAQQQSVQAQRNALNLYPSQRKLLQAQLKSQQSRLDSAVLNLSYTEVRMPFTGRVSESNIEMDQFVREGDKLVVADDLSMAEIELQVPITQMSALMGNFKRRVDGSQSQRDAYEQMGISVLVAMNEGNLQATWPGRFARISDSLDPKTRTIGIIVEVDNPYKLIEVGKRPPLAKGMFVNVVLQAQTLTGQIVIPRSAVHGGKVYVVNGENRLQIRDVESSIKQPEYVIVESGLNEDDKVIVSTVSPAIEGMLLSPTFDNNSSERLKHVVKGEKS